MSTRTTQTAPWNLYHAVFGSATAPVYGRNEDEALVDGRRFGTPDCVRLVRSLTEEEIEALELDQDPYAALVEMGFPEAAEL